MSPLRRVSSLIAVALVTSGVSLPAQQTLVTRPERTEFKETSSHADVMSFVEQVVAASPNRMRLTTFGTTNENRALPLVVVGSARDATPGAVRAGGKLRVYLQGNIHAGEVEGKESLQMLLRELAQGQHAEWLDSLVLLVAPIYNADGNERVKLDNRNRQHGPEGGMGQRPNAQELDLDRDHMKLDSPEARAFVKLQSDYDPQVSVDLHTTNGTRHAYYLTYSPPLHPNTDAAIIAMLRNDWLPQVTRNIKSKHNWDYYYYGNVAGGAGGGGRGGRGGRGGGTPRERGWYTFDHRPRFNNNYVGLRNRFAILSEAYAYATFEDRIKATSWFLEEVLDYAYRHTSAIRRAVEAADRASVVGQDLGLRATFERSDTVTILMGDVAIETHPVTGDTIWRRLDVVTPDRMPEFGTFRSSETTPAPANYYVPAELTTVLDMLTSHGVRWSKLDRPLARTVERFAIDSSTQVQGPNEGHRERTLFGRYETAQVTLPAGTAVVPVAQPLGRLAFTLLEPRSDDGMANWNVLDAVLEGVRQYPIVRGR